MSSQPFILAAVLSAVLAAAEPPLPELTQPVNDFANIIDPSSEAEIDRLSRALKAASSDALVVATVPTVEPYADIREYAVRLFENRGKGIGDKGKDNGLLILLALKERRVWIEVGYGLEEWITDGFAGETSRDVMAPEFRNGRYGPGLLAGATRIAFRIAQGRGVPLTGYDVPREPEGRPVRIPIGTIITLLILFIILSRGGMGGPRRGIRRWGGGGWSGWSSGVGSLGGGWGGRSGGFGGGFGGFGGGRSGGGGGGAGW